jgi:hypothetical protein
MSVKVTEMRFQINLAWANWYTHAANNGHCEVAHDDNHKLTPDELRDHAMERAERHLHLAQRYINRLDNDEYVPGGDW